MDELIDELMPGSIPGSIEFRSFEDRSAASIAASELLADLIREDLTENPTTRASLVVSGGSTPGPCFEQLSHSALDWSRVTVVPSDERWVSVSHSDSNERLIKQRLLQDHATKGQVLPFYRAGLDASQAPTMIEQDLLGLQQPFSASLLGMGEDGHFASLFPDFDDLEQALDPLNDTACIMVQTVGSPHLRISLTLSALLNSAHIVLLIFGEAKRLVFETAISGNSGYPVEALLSHATTPLTVIWAP